MLKNILIDAVNYRVEITDERIIVDGQECGADVDYNLALIRLSDKVGEGIKAKFLMHEIFHALLNERGMFEDSRNEELVDELAAGTINLIRENPKLIDFLRGDNLDTD